jgi:hypothetical protein
MEQPELMKKLETLLDDMKRRRVFGTIDIEIREGTPVLIRKIETEKIQSTGNSTHANKLQR